MKEESVRSFSDFFDSPKIDIEDSSNPYKSFKPIQKVEETKEEIVEDEIIEQEPVLIKENFLQEDDSDYYKVYKDKSENFTCDIAIEGAKPEETFARLVIESDDWSLVFNGDIQNGKCIIPIRKLNILNEGQVGKIKLEVIAEGNLFVPWEDKFKVKLSKKVLVNVHNESKSSTKKYTEPSVGIKVNVKK